jgi:zinc protease
LALNPKRVVLPNGITVLAKANHTSPTISLVVGVRTGAYSDPPDRDGTAALCARVLDRGTAKRSAEMIADELDGRGASLSVVAGRHQMALAATCLAEDFDPVLLLAADVLRHPAFKDHEIATRKEQLITAIRQEEDNPATVAGDIFARTLYGAHPYARKVRGTIEAIEHIRRQDLVRFHQKGFDPPIMTVVVVGDIIEEFAITSISKLFGDWPASTKATDTPLVTVPDPVPPAARQLVSVPMMNKSQADVVYGFVGVRRADPDFTAISVMNNALGQYAIGGKLGDSIRERQGMAYYVYSSLDATFGAGPFSIRAGVAAANVEKTIASIDNELKTVIRDGFTAQEIEESKSYMIGSLPRQLETNAAIASFLLNVETFGLGLDYDERLPGMIKAVTREAADAAARRLLNPDRAVIAVAGPWQPASPAIVPVSSGAAAGPDPEATAVLAATPAPPAASPGPPAPAHPEVPAMASGPPRAGDDEATARLPRLPGNPPPLGDTPSSSGETG